jgi:signal peptidase I
MPRQKSTFRLIVEPLAVAVGLAMLVRASIVRLFTIPSASMLPTLQIGDHIVVTPYGSDSPSPGDVVVFQSAGNPGDLIVKRIIAVPGDLIETRAGRVVVGGHALAEPYLATQAASGTIDPQIIPSECFFVMGDNRALSLDSRSSGCVPRQHIVGRARLVLWSSGTGFSPSEVQAATRSTQSVRDSVFRADRIFKWIE